MGYTTDFSGSWQLNKPLDDETFTLLDGLNRSRRMKRQGLDPKYGVEGEFYFDPNDLENHGQSHRDDPSIVNHNSPPSTQPGLWCRWCPSVDRTEIVWDGGEKFYNYEEWIAYLIDTILAPRGYVLNGEVTWTGEDRDDLGKIRIDNNLITVQHGVITYE